MTDPDGARGIVPSVNRGKRYAEIFSWPEAVHHLHSGRHFPVFADIKRQANPSRSRLRILDTWGKKNPTPVGHGIKDSIFAMDQGGSNIASGGR